MLYRPYWSTTGVVVVLSGGAGVILLALASLATSRGDHDVLLRSLIVLLALTLLSLAIRAWRAGIHVSPLGVTVQGWLRDHFVEWPQVRCFGIATAQFAHGLYVERTDGVRLRCLFFSDGPEVHLLGGAEHTQRVLETLEDVRRRVS